MTRVANLRVAVAGIFGKMGRETAEAILGAGDLTLVAGIDRAGRPNPPRPASAEIPVFSDLGECAARTAPDVLVDFTRADSARVQVPLAIELGIRPVVGTTGLTRDDLESWRQRLAENGLGGIYAPNFAVGALLMMRAAQLAAPYLPDVEIIEYHHAGKRDAPSGTAVRTAELVAAARSGSRPGLSGESREGARGTSVAGIPVHSVRMDGFIAHQEVILGGPGERLTIRHDSSSRSGFMPGVLLAVRKVSAVNGLVEGLESLLF